MLLLIIAFFLEEKIVAYYSGIGKSDKILIIVK